MKVRRLLEIIRQDVAEDKVRIDTPTQNLESYFLEVVQNARRAAAETSLRRCNDLDVRPSGRRAGQVSNLDT